MNLTRRDFTKLSSLALAAEFVPQLHSQPAGKKVGYAIIGLGRIADLHMQGIHESPTSKVTALVSGHPEKARKYAAQYGVPASSIYSYETMDAIRDNLAVDATYVCLPNSMHAEYTIRSAKAGKHVFCEKPMATSVSDSKAMIAACRAAGVKLMMGYRCHYETTNLAAIKLIRDGALGEVRSIQSAFGFNADPRDWRVNMPLAGGGPLMDVGIYCLNATRYLTGEEPSSISAYSSNDPHDPRFNHPNSVEEDLVWTTKFPSGIVASCSTSYGANLDGYYRVYGSKGWLAVNSAFSYEGLVLKAQYRKDDGQFIELNQPNSEKIPTHFLNEANHFSHCILTDQTPQSPGEEGLRDMECIQQIYKSAGIQMG
jgi:predicted dehydrogenase